MFSGKRSPILWVLATSFYMTLLMTGSLQPYVRQGEQPLWQEILHNALHAPAYAGLTFLWAGTLGALKFRGKIIPWAFVIAFTYGAVIEILQGGALGRTPSVMDIFINMSGALAAAYVIRRGWFWNLELNLWGER